MTSKEFEHIAIRLRPRLLQIAMSVCHDKDDAEDIVQEVMLRLWMRRNELEHDVTLLACKATRNLCVSWWRKGQVRRLIPLADDLIAEEDHHADDRLMADEQMTQLQQCIAQLNRSEQRLIKLMLFDGLNAHEIAAIVGITTGSASTMLSLAKRKLMEMLIRNA